jgi:hypothetical protein
MAKTEKADALVVKQEGGGEVAVPEYLQKYMNKGTEHITKDDLQIPRLALAQGLSPQLIPDKAEYVKGLVLGDAYNSATAQIYGRGPWSVAIVTAYPPRWVEFIPRSDGGGIKDPNVPFGDPRTMFGPNGEKPKATKFYDYIVVFLDTKETIALSLKSTGIRVAKKLNTLIVKRGGIPIFMGKYSLRAVMAKGAKGDYATFQVNNDGHVTDEETLKFLAAQYETFQKKEVVIDREPGSDDDEAEADM